jgi:uncharacterized membrane protein
MEEATMSARTRRSRTPKVDLSAPRRQSRLRLGVHYDPEAFGRFSEGIARFIGTARFLVYQSVLVAIWILWNVFMPLRFRFDRTPFIGLTLVLSLQAAYAAPLILLAQNRQADRDRVVGERNRETAIRTQSDTEFLGRELAAIRIALADAVTSDELDKALDRAISRSRQLDNEDRADRADRADRL